MAFRWTCLLSLWNSLRSGSHEVPVEYRTPSSKDIKEIMPKAKPFCHWPIDNRAGMVLIDHLRPTSCI